MNTLPIELLTIIATDSFEVWIIISQTLPQLTHPYAQTIAKQKFIKITPQATYLNGKLHSFNDLPSINNNNKQWHCYGKLHRLNGPAIEYINGDKCWFMNDKLHREGDLPTTEFANGDKEWCQNNKLHRVKGPAIERANGDKHWYINNKRHRIDGPAIEFANDTKYWYINGKLHREGNLPAIEYANDTKYWYVNDKLHRGGNLPAVEYANGDKEWWINGEMYNEEEVLPMIEK